MRRSRKVSHVLSRAHQNGYTPQQGISNSILMLPFSMGVGAVVRDSVGEVLMTTCKTEGGDCEVEVAEALAARHGLQIALEAGQLDP